ncbi:hypothetical protein AA105894_2564 [Asaia spathodeae NBRC 105894]|nr:hypothetical protein AA105894_2564 [Asaia spathodeae NBRC 105894]
MIEQHSFEVSFAGRLTQIIINREKQLQPGMYKAEQYLIAYRGNFSYLDEYAHGIDRQFWFFVRQEDADNVNILSDQARAAFQLAYTRVAEDFASDRKDENT